MSSNPAAISNQGEFHSKKMHSEPLESGGHQMGQHFSPTDGIPTFTAQTLPPGSAPKSATFRPNPELNNQRMYQDASTTLQGADSSDVYRGLGHPGGGMTSRELRHNGQHPGKKERLGNIGLSSTNMAGVDPRDPEFADQRALDKDVPAGRR